MQWRNTFLSTGSGLTADMGPRVSVKLVDRGVESPGTLLKAARAAKGLTLADVRDRSGLPISTLSKIENGKMGLSYDKLMKLGSGLGLDIAQLLTGSHREERAAPQFISGRRSVTRKGEEQIAETATYRFGYHAAELLGKAIDPMMIDVDARSIEEFGKLTRHAGEVFAYVVEGEIDFHCELYAPTRLNEGDSIYFDAAMGHAYVAASSGRCRILSICTGLVEHAVADQMAPAAKHEVEPLQQPRARKQRRREIEVA